ncbi:MAG: RNA polymerase sigma factor [Saprospiraceae bacterium]
MTANNIILLNQDHEILKAVAEGDRKAFQQLYTLFSEKVYNTALSYAQNIHNAEEITQDVFTSIFNNAGKFKGNSAVGTWIYRIAVNTSLNHLKKKKRFSFLAFGETEKETPDFEHPGILLENKEKAKMLFKVIETLPDSQKTAFILSFVEELPRQEVADIMEISLKAVESLLQRAKLNLRKKLEKQYPNRRKKK